MTPSRSASELSRQVPLGRLTALGSPTAQALADGKYPPNLISLTASIVPYEDAVNPRSDPLSPVLSGDSPGVGLNIRPGVISRV